jgi:hypothetical protein
MKHPEFTAEEWENAPVYDAPGLTELHRHTRTTILDFASLQMIAHAQESAGAFRSASSLESPKAPIKLGDIPAAFVKVVSLNEDDYVVHTPHGPEILVVLNGILTVKNSRFASLTRPRAGSSQPLASGDVIALAPEGVQLTAHGYDMQAASLALSILDIHPRQTEFIIMQGRFNGPKEIGPEGRTKLPYED